MQVTTITSPAEAHSPAAHQLTNKQIYDEINYFRATLLIKKMRDAGLITPDEYERIEEEIRRIFIPFLAEIL